MYVVSFHLYHGNTIMESIERDSEQVDSFTISLTKKDLQEQHDNYKVILHGIYEVADIPEAK